MIHLDRAGRVIGSFDAPQGHGMDVEAHVPLRRQRQTLHRHRLRSPLGAISYSSQALERAHGGSERASLHAIIARQVQHVSRLVDELLDVERVVA
jgi:signal transduction histidine kinase